MSTKKKVILIVIVLYAVGVIGFAWYLFRVARI